MRVIHAKAMKIHLNLLKLYIVKCRLFPGHGVHVCVIDALTDCERLSEGYGLAVT